MNELEREIIEKFHQLDKDAQQRIRVLIDQEAESEQGRVESFDYAAWLQDIEGLREQIRASHAGKFPSIDAIGLLREIRDGEDE